MNFGSWRPRGLVGPGPACYHGGGGRHLPLDDEPSPAIPTIQTEVGHPLKKPTESAAFTSSARRHWLRKGPFLGIREGRVDGWTLGDGKKMPSRRTAIVFFFWIEIWFRYSRYTVWGQVIEVVVYFKCFFFTESS